MNELYTLIGIFMSGTGFLASVYVLVNIVIKHHKYECSRGLKI